MKRYNFESCWFLVCSALLILACLVAIKGGNKIKIKNVITDKRHLLPAIGMG